MRDMMHWPFRRWMAALIGTALVAAAIALPTAMVPNSIFGRTVPVTWWSWPVLAVTSVLGGLLLATYVRTPDTDGGGGRAGATGGVLSMLAVGCPVCNKLVVLALGASGAMQWWAPLQPLVGVGSVVLLGWGLRTRLKGERACRVRPAAEQTPAEQTLADQTLAEQTPADQAPADQLSAKVSG